MRKDFLQGQGQVQDQVFVVFELDLKPGLKLKLKLP